jgi:BirA family biotin operon repressor/biotin-[acetyl-CoA-carboxylase] ligase
LPLPSAADLSTTSFVRYDGQTGEALARRLGLANVVAFDETTSTLDVAHRLGAEGAPAGTLILADMQRAGRGRQGRSWTSERGAGIWLTLIERPSDLAAIEVLSLRVGSALAVALDAFAERTVSLKWPNDVYVGERKLAGILVEARWRESTPEWVAIGVGINVRPPASESRAIGVRTGTSRLAILDAVIPRIRAVAVQRGGLTPAEIDAFARRDFARGRRCVQPVHGMVQGIDARGALLVDVGGEVVSVRSGSLVLKEEQ